MNVLILDDHEAFDGLTAEAAQLARLILIRAGEGYLVAKDRYGVAGQVLDPAQAEAMVADYGKEA